MRNAETADGYPSGKNSTEPGVGASGSVRSFGPLFPNSDRSLGPVPAAPSCKYCGTASAFFAAACAPCAGTRYAPATIRSAQRIDRQIRWDWLLLTAGFTSATIPGCASGRRKLQELRIIPLANLLPYSCFFILGKSGIWPSQEICSADLDSAHRFVHAGNRLLRASSQKIHCRFEDSGDLDAVFGQLPAWRRTFGW